MKLLIPLCVPFVLLIDAMSSTDPNDPCNNYTSLNQPWRANNETGLWIRDQDFSWNGWYRLFYHGMNIRMPESCVAAGICGGFYTIWLNGPHPQIQDGVVTRQVCASTGYDCCIFRPKPIRVKACPGSYYVYELLSPPTVDSADGSMVYCTDVSTITPTAAPTTNATAQRSNDTIAKTPTNYSYDPCNNYTVLDDIWRNTTSLYTIHNGGHDDSLVEWNGWYRLYLHGLSAQIPEWRVTGMQCGGYTPLWLGGSHPQPEDGIVTREVSGAYYYISITYIYAKSNPIQVKACPGNYYVYKLVKPPVSLPMPSYCAVAFVKPSYDPCNNYKELDEPWRATNNTEPSWICQTTIDWNGWYRLFYRGKSVRMPDSCVNENRCGSAYSLWLNDTHPRLEDGVVVRQVCGRSFDDCCYLRSYPIQVKACPGNFYVYELVKPLICYAFYCTDVDSIATTPETPTTRVFKASTTVSTTTTTVSSSTVKNPPLTTTTTTVHLSSNTTRVDPCAELNCTADEWCGDRDGVYGCLCNENLQRQESYDSTETCQSSSGTMSLSRCQLFEAGFPANVLHLSDPNCNGTLQNGRLVFNFDNDDHICGTNLTANGTHFIYENSIHGVADFAGGAINRKKRLDLRFSCIYELSQTLTMDTEFNALQSIVHKTFPDGQGMYQVRMIPYQDAAFSHPYNGIVDIVVDQRIYVEVTVKGVDSRQISTVIDSCWATPVNDQNYAVRWNLINNKCPNSGDHTVDVLQNGVSTIGRFSFKMFAFNDNYSKVYLHCSIHLCLLQSSNCAVNCSPGQQRRAGRAVDIHDRASISVGPFTWTARSTDD